MFQFLTQTNTKVQNRALVKPEAASIKRSAWVLVALLMASDAACSQDNLRPDGSIVTIDAFELAVLPFQLEVCFVVIEIPVFPIARVVTFLTACAECALMRILLFMA